MGISGGVLWLPDNPLMQREGVSDSLETAMDYFASVVGGNATASVMGRAYPAVGASIGATCVFAFIAAGHAAAG